MTIDRLGGLNPLQNVHNSYRTQKSEAVTPSDSVSVSEEAWVLLDAKVAMEQVSKAADIREDRIAEVQAKLQDPDYINDAVVNVVADRIMGVFGI